MEEGNNNEKHYEKHTKSVERASSIFFVIVVALLIVITLFSTKFFYNNQTETPKVLLNSTKIDLVDIKKAKVVKDYETECTIDNFDYIEFGKYNDKPIEWIVLEANKGEALVVSKYVLKSIPFSKDNEKGVLENWWDVSEIKEWLNNDFYNNAFDDDQKKEIIGKKSKIFTTKKDNVTILNNKDIKKFFGEDNKELIENHTKTRLFPGEKDDNIDVLNKYVPYWTKTDKDNRISVIDNEGKLNVEGYRPTYNRIGVRPAIYIKY